MHRAGAGRAGSVQNGVDVEIAFRGRGTADADGVIGLGHKGRVAVGLGKDRHTFQPQLAATALDTPGDFATVGDQDTGKAHFTRHDGMLLLRKLLMPSMPSLVSHASASRSAV